MSRFTTPAVRDCAVAGAMLVFALVVILESWRMPVFGGAVWKAPGLFPAVSGLVIALLSLLILASRLPHVLGWRPTPAEPPEEELGSIRVVLICATVVGVAVLLILPRLGFIGAGIAATLGLMLVSLGRRPRLWEAALIAACSVGLPVLIYLLFTRVFLTPLP